MRVRRVARRAGQVVAATAAAAVLLIGGAANATADDLTGTVSEPDGNAHNLNGTVNSESESQDEPDDAWWDSAEQPDRSPGGDAGTFRPNHATWE